jgi:dTMP kinase
MRGKLIVIEGSDGSGKATQVKLLIERLRAEGSRVGTLSFPRYGKESAKKIQDYLAGKFGPPNQVDPYEASKIYAPDRVEASPEVRAALEKGDLEILDRYTPSNAGHQGGKIKDLEARSTFIKWLYQYEYEDLGIPRPDLVVILHVPVAVSLKLMEERDRGNDGHEADIEHLQNAEAAYLWLAEQYPDDHKVVECAEGGEILPPEVIAEKVYALVKPLLQ